MKLMLEPEDRTSFDLVALGEVMLRLDPGEARIRTARTFHTWEGGGEYNVARGLKSCFRQRTAVVTALVDDEVGRLIEGLVLQSGVVTDLIRWRGSDGTGSSVRNGLNFVERGFGVRPPVGVSDRGHTATSQLRPGDVDWEAVFEQHRTRWFHTGGVFAGLSSTTPDVAAEAMIAAKKHGAVVSYDLNYRHSLWQSRGGPEAANAVNDLLVPRADVVFGFPRRDPTELAHLPQEQLAGVLSELTHEHPQVALFAGTLRVVRDASSHSWGAAAVTKDGCVLADRRHHVPVLDRTGSGDAFAAGVIFGLLTGSDVASSLELGSAHGRLAMTTPGDNSMATLAEVVSLTATGQGEFER